MESEHFVGKVSLRGVVERGDTVLVCRDLQDEIWQWPGGRLHKGEAPAAALKREFIEELSFEIEVKNIFYTEQWMHVKSGTPQVFLFFRCSATGAATPDQKEIGEVRWVTKEELKVLPMWEDCRRAADEYLKL